MNWDTPFHYDFLRMALGIAALVGAVCAVFSCFLVLKGWSLLGDAISHAVLPGIVVAYVTGLPLAAGAFASGLFCAVATGFIQRHSKIKEDTALGVVFTGLFALGLVIYSRMESDLHLNHVLFGSLLGLPRSQVLQIVGISVFTLSLTLILRKDLLLFCFDPGQARAVGLNPKILNYLMLILLSLTIVASLQAVGVILVVAMLITPGCVGFLISDRFPTMMTIAVSSAVLASLIGTYASFFLNASTGACIVLTQSGFFLLSLFFAPKRGLLANRRRYRQNTETVLRKEPLQDAA